VNIVEMRDRVRYILTDLLGPVEVDRDGEFSFRHDSARIFVGVRPFDEGTVVEVRAYTNIGVPPSPELYEYLALNANAYVFGHLGAFEDEGGMVVIFSHRLLGDYLDPEELKVAVAAVASTADEIDDEIRDRFGGRLFHEEE
jgi:hypothetical protein